MASSNVWIPHLMIWMKENLDLYSVLVMSMTSSTLVLICTKSFQIKFDESDPDLMLSTPSSEYYSITDANNLLADVDNDSIFLFHCNIRSLAKNFELLNDLLYCCDNIPNVIAVTETRINCNSSANIDFPNYKFYSTDSKTIGWWCWYLHLILPKCNS